MTPLLNQSSERRIDIASETSKGFLVDHDSTHAFVFAQHRLQRLKSPLGHGLLLYI